MQSVYVDHNMTLMLRPDDTVYQEKWWQGGQYEAKKENHSW